MPPETCEYHVQLVSDIAVIKTDISYIKDKVCTHIQEGEEKGGFRDRLIILEQSVSELKKAMWGRLIVSGIIGGLIGSGSVDALNLFFQWIMKR